MRIQIEAATAFSTVAVLGALTACDDGLERPTQNELTEKLIADEGVPEAIAKCMAQVLIDSDISNEALRALADGAQDDYQGNDEDRVAEAAAREVFIAECI